MRRVSASARSASLIYTLPPEYNVTLMMLSISYCNNRNFDSVNQPYLETTTTIVSQTLFGMHAPHENILAMKVTNAFIYDNSH